MAGKNSKAQSEKDKESARQAKAKTQQEATVSRKDRNAAKRAAQVTSANDEEVTPSVASESPTTSAPEVVDTPAAPEAAPAAVDASAETPAKATLEQGDKGFVKQKREELEAKIAAVNAAKKPKSPRENSETLTEREQAILDEIKTSRSGKKSVKEIAHAFNKWEVPNDEYEAPNKSSSDANADPTLEKEERERERSQIAQKHAESLASEDLHKPTQEEVENRGNPNWKNPERESRYQEMENLRSREGASPSVEDLASQFEATRRANVQSTAAREPDPARVETGAVNAPAQQAAPALQETPAATVEPVVEAAVQQADPAVEAPAEAAATVEQAQAQQTAPAATVEPVVEAAAATVGPGAQQETPAAQQAAVEAPAEVTPAQQEAQVEAPAAAATPAPETGQTQQAAQSSPEEEEEKLEKSWLSKIPNRDSSRPLNFQVIKNLVKEGRTDLDIHNIEGKLTQENGISKKAFDDGITNVELTYGKHKAPNDKYRDVDINVKKGPAVVTLAMSDEKGKRSKGKGLVIEYDKNGNPIDSVPDLRLARFDQSTPPVASIMVGKEVIYLPINGDKVKDLITKIETRKGKIREQDRKVAKEVGSETPAPALSDIELKYKELYKQYMASAVNSPEAIALLPKSEEAKKALLEQEPRTEQGAKLININRKAEEELKAQAEKDLKEALKAEISAKAKGEDPSVTDATKKENAKKTLGRLGENPKEIENIEKKARKEAYSEALREEFAHMLAAGDGKEARRKQEAAIEPEKAPKILDFLKDAYSHLASQELSERQQGQDPAETVLLQQSVVQYSSELGKTITPQEELEYKKQAVKTAASGSPDQQESIKKAADKMLGVYQDRGQKAASAMREGLESTVHAISSIPTRKKGQEASMER